MDAGLITLIVNLLLALFVVWGVLWGLGRGLVKSSIRFAYFVGFVIIFAIASPFISQAVLGIQFPQIGSINEYLQDAISNNATIQGFFGDNAAFQDLVEKLPAVIVNLVVFVLLVILAKFFSWIGYKITCRIHFPKKKKQKEAPVQAKFGDKVYTVVDGKPVIIEPKKEKKHRLLGGLVGGIQGIVIMFCLFLPISGVISMAGQYIDTSAEAQSVALAESEFKYKEISDYLKSELPPEVLDYLKAYQNSITNKIFTIGNADLLCFDAITSTTIDGERVKIRQEIDTVAQVVESTLYVDRITKTEDFSWDTLDFDKLYTAIDAIFDSGLVKSIGMSTISQVLAMIIDNEQYIETDIVETDEDGNTIYDEDGITPKKVKIDNPFYNAFKQTGMETEIYRVLSAIQDNLEDGKMDKTLKNDLLALVGIGEQICESGLIDALNAANKSSTDSLEITPDTFIDTLTKVNPDNDKTYLHNSFISLFKSSTLRTIVIETANIALEKLQEQITINIAENSDTLYQNATTESDRQSRINILKDNYAFDVLDVDKASWSGLASNLNTICERGISIYNFYQENDTFFKKFNAEKDADWKTLFTLDGYKYAVDSVGEILNKFTSFEFFNGSATSGGHSILSQALSYANKMYVDFKDNNNFEKVETYFDLTELDSFDWKANFTDLFYDMSQIAIEPLAFEPTAENPIFDFKTLNYFGKDVNGEHKNGIAEVFDKFLSGQMFKAVKTDALTLFDETVSDYSSRGGENADKIVNVWNELKTIFIDNPTDPADKVQYSFADKKGEFLPFVNFLCKLGDIGVYDIIVGLDELARQTENAITETELNDYISSLNEIKTGQTESPASQVLGYLFDSNLLKLGAITLINEFGLPIMENTPNELGRIDKTYDWEGWDDVEADVKTLAENVILVYENICDTLYADTTPSNKIKTLFTTIIDDKFAPTLSPTTYTATSTLMGESIDILHNSALFDYEITPADGDTPAVMGNILTNILNLFVKDFIYVGDATSANRNSDFWKAEMELLAPYLVTLNNKNIDANNTLLMSLIDDSYTAIKTLNFGSENPALVGTISDMLTHSSILKSFAVATFNTINQEVYNFVDNTQVVPQIDETTNLQVQSADLKQVLISAQTCLSIFDNAEISSFADVFATTDNIAKMKALISAIKENAKLYVVAETDGVFKPTAELINEKFVEIANEIHNQISKLPYVATYNVPDPEVYSGITLTEVISQFEDFADLINKVSKIPTNQSVKAMATNDANKANIIAVLTALQNIYNDTENHSKIFAKTYENFAINLERHITDDLTDDFVALSSYIDAHDDPSSPDDYVGANVSNFDWAKIINAFASLT